MTSVGRDGEERDVIDSRIEKPRVVLSAGEPRRHDRRAAARQRHPTRAARAARRAHALGRVLLARLEGAGAIEVAGPSAAADVRAVSDAMLAQGAEQVLIDGAIDRRAASSPAVADGLIIATGAVLDHDIDEVVLQTRDAVELVRLASVDEATQTPGRALRELAEGGRSMLVGEDLEPAALPPRFLLSADSEQVAQLLDENPSARWLIVAGALPERFLRGLLHPVRKRRRQLVIVVADPTKVFLWKRGPEWYRRQGVVLRTLDRIALEAITVNPVAPQSHRFDSEQLRGLLAQAIPDVPISTCSAPTTKPCARRLRPLDAAPANGQVGDAVAALDVALWAARQASLTGARTSVSTATMRSVKVALAAGLTLLALAIGLTLLGSPMSVARANRPAGQPEEPVASTTQSAHYCEAGEVLPSGTSALRIWLEAAAGPRVNVAVYSNGRLVTDGHRGSDWIGGSVTVPVRPLSRTVSRDGLRVVRVAG